MKILLITLLFAIALLSWQDWPAPQQIADKTVEMATRKSDYYLEAFTIDTLTDTGKLKHRLSGTALTHYPHDDTAEIDALQLQLKRPAKTDWSISSERSWLSSGATQIDLLGKVVMIRGSVPEAPGMRIDSSNMHIDISMNKIITDQAVVIASERWQAQGVGLRGNTEFGDFALLANVVFTYAPQPI